MQRQDDREALADDANPAGMEGIEFIEFATARPQALGHALETMGFRPVARHRAREVLLYRQGAMNLVVNAHAGGGSAGGAPAEGATIAAVAVRVRNAEAAYRRAIDRGAWAVPTHPEVMELNIPAIHGVGRSRIHFVDRWRDFSIFDIDFVPIPTVEARPPAVAGLHWFGLVQYIGNFRTEDWTEFYRELLGFEPVPDEERHGILPKGRVLRSPCRSFHLQLIEPEPSILDLESEEAWVRIGLGAPDVPEAVASLRRLGTSFVESHDRSADVRGALTTGSPAGAVFELVHDDDSAAAPFAAGR